VVGWFGLETIGEGGTRPIVRDYKIYMLEHTQITISDILTVPGVLLAARRRAR
jgi:hypothetical protein